MEIKTRFNTEDIVYFLTAESDYLDNVEKTLKVGEVFVCKGEVGEIDIKYNNNENYDIVCSVYIKVLNGIRQVQIHEDFLAPDPTQLGVNVTNRYYKSGENNQKI